MPELSMNIMDIAQNSVAAHASLIEIDVRYIEDALYITVKDNGDGMDDEQLSKATDPFSTSRTTRKVGLGIPLFKTACELTGGKFELTSKKGEGTVIKGGFDTSNIDMPPMGNLAETVHLLIISNPNIDFLFSYAVDGEHFILDTRTLREILDGVSFTNPETSSWIKEYITENIDTVIAKGEEH